MIKGGKVPADNEHLPAGAKREAGDDVPMDAGRRVEAGTSELMSEEEFRQRELRAHEEEIRLQKRRELNKSVFLFLLAIILVIVLGKIGLDAYQEYKDWKKTKEEQDAAEADKRYQDSMQDILDEGMRFFNNEEYISAIDSFSRVEKEADCYKEAQEYIDLSKKYFEEDSIKAAESCLTDKKFVEAIAYLDQAKEYLGNKESLRTRKEAILAAYKESALAVAATLVESEDYDSAIAVLKEFLKVQPGDFEAQDFLDNYEDSRIMLRMSEYHENGQYLEAMKFVQGLESKYRNQDNVQTFYQELAGYYKADVVKQAKDLVKDKDYTAAINAVQTGIKNLGSDAELTALLNDLQSEQIEKEGFSGRIATEGQQDTYQFITGAEGNYRFEIEDDNAAAGYRFVVSDSTGKEYKNASMSQDRGVTVELEANKEYTLTLKQSYEYAKYRLIIHMPEEEKTIAFDTRKVSGSIQYIDQIDKYVYTPQISGIYRFDIEDDNDSAYYRFVLTDDRGEVLKDTNFDYDNGKTVTLEAGNTYYISLKQTSEFANYSLKIGVPKEIQAISGSSFSGSISYEEQEDRYTYTAPVSGTYAFTIEDDNDSAYYRLVVQDARGEYLRDSNFDTDREKTVDLDAGDTYLITIMQQSDYSNYTVKIAY